MPLKKKEKASMSDLDKDLNFDDIAGKKQAVANPVPKKKKPAPVVTGKTDKTAGIMLTVQGDGKDILQCTGQEFVSWAHGVYPVDLTEYVDKFGTPDNRLRMFKKILHYHVNSPFWMGTKKKPNPVDTPN